MGREESGFHQKGYAGSYQGGVKSPVLTEVKKSDKVTVLEDENDWMKVATKDGLSDM